MGTNDSHYWHGRLATAIALGIRELHDGNPHWAMQDLQRVLGDYIACNAGSELNEQLAELARLPRVEP